MINYSINESHIKRDSWVKSIRKNYGPEQLAELIKKRIDYPASTGPYVRSHQDEEPSDIIDAFIKDDEEYRKKLEPAVGLLLYKMMNNEIPENHDLLRGIFSIIKHSKLTNCHSLVYDWLKYKFAVMTMGGNSINGQKWRNTFRDGLLAFAQIQPKDAAIEYWWFNIWRESAIAWWASAFTGLRIQNPVAASKELQLMISRNTDKTVFLLVGMWNDANSRELLETAIRIGLEEDTGWAGLALNMLLEKLSEKERNQIMLSLKNIDPSILQTTEQDRQKVCAL